MRAAAMLVLIGAVASVFGGESQFTPLGRATDNLETHTAMWFRPDLGTAADIVPLKTRVWATQESVTGGVAMKCLFEPGSKATLAMEMTPLPAGSAGLTMYVKASRALKISINKLPYDAGTEWKKIDIAWEKFGTTKDKPEIGWQLIVKAEDPIAEKTWLIIDRIGTESPDFIAQPKIEPKAGPDTVISSKDIVLGAESLAKTVARLKEKKPVKIFALGDSVTAGAQCNRSTWALKVPDGVPYLYFSHLARILQKEFDAKDVTPVQRGHGGWTAAQGLTVVEKDVVAEATANDLVIIEFGANDMGWAKVPPETWKANIKKLIAAVKAKTDQIIVLSPTPGGEVPAQADVISAKLKEIIAEEKVAGVDITRLNMYRGTPFCWAMMANEFHPDFMGHITMAEMIAPLLTGKHINYPE